MYKMSYSSKGLLFCHQNSKCHTNDVIYSKQLSYSCSRWALSRMAACMHSINYKRAHWRDVDPIENLVRSQIAVIVSGVYNGGYWVRQWKSLFLEIASAVQRIYGTRCDTTRISPRNSFDIVIIAITTIGLAKLLGQNGHNHDHVRSMIRSGDGWRDGPI
jgi:hypothetical protein